MPGRKVFLLVLNSCGHHAKWFDQKPVFLVFDGSQGGGSTCKIGNIAIGVVMVPTFQEKWDNPMDGDETGGRDGSWRFGPDWPGQRCLAQLRGKPGQYCQKPALKGRDRCQLHGGKSTGAPFGPANGNYRNGEWTNDAIEERRKERHQTSKKSVAGGRKTSRRASPGVETDRRWRSKNVEKRR